MTTDRRSSRDTTAVRVANASPVASEMPFAAALCTALFCLFGVTASFAQEIRTTIDKRQATLEDQLTLSVIIDGTRSAKPQAPDLSAFQVYERGASQHMQFVNGRMTASVIYQYVLVPKSVGTFTIGAFTVELGGRTLASEPLQVQIGSAAAPSAQPRELFVTAEVSDRSPYVGEQVIFTWRFYRRLQIGGAQLESHETEGFLLEDLGKAREYGTKVGGVDYAVHEVKMALFPQEPGPAVIRPGTLRVEVLYRSRGRGGSLIDEFLGSRIRQEEKHLRADPIELEVRPLPPGPPDFTGLVGKFDVRGKLSKPVLTVGESTTLEVVVLGTGNVQSIPEPKMPELDGFKVYDDKPTTSIDRSGGALKGRRTFNRALVPLISGELEIPPVRISYFDPDAESYRTAATPAFAVSVAPGTVDEELNVTELRAPGAGKVAVRILADDILPIRTDLAALSPRTSDLWWGSLLVAPPLLFVGWLLSHRRQRRWALDVGLRRRRGALTKANKALRGVAQLQGAAAVERVSRCLREYLGDRLGIEGAALTAAEVDDLLRHHGVDEPLVQRVHALLDRLEAAQYSPAGGVDAASLAAAAKGLLEKLEGEMR